MKKLFVSILLSIGLTACGSTFYDRVAVAQVTNTTVLEAIGTAATTNKITKAEAQNLVKQVDAAQEGIVLARSMPAEVASDKLMMARQVLETINDYLRKKGVQPK